MESAPVPARLALPIGWRPTAHVRRRPHDWRCRRGPHVPRRAHSAAAASADAVSRVAYFDCFSGASGDMILGALIDAGLSVDDLRADLAHLGVDGFGVRAERVDRGGLVGTEMHVDMRETSTSPRHLGEIERLIESSGLDRS